jgi:hypothetical protein
MSAQQDPLERNTVSPEPMYFSSINISQSLQLRSPSTKWGQNIRSPSTEPHVHGRPTYSGVQPGSPVGSFTSLLSLPQCHAAYSDTFDFGFCRPDPCQPACVLVPLRGYTIHIYCRVPRDLGYDST